MPFCFLLCLLAQVTCFNRYLLIVCDCFINLKMKNYTGCKLGSLLAKEKCAGYVLRSKGQPWSTSSVCSRTRGACCYWCPWHHPPSIPIKSLRYGPVFSMSNTMDLKWLVLNWTVNMIDQEYFVIILFLLMIHLNFQTK